MVGELQHHGILGQKWGVRRYQNPDGSLTPAGRKRYANEIKRDLKKQNAKTDKALFKYGFYSKQYNDLHKNLHAVDDRMNEEARNSKEYKNYDKVKKDFENAITKWMDEGANIDSKDYWKANERYKKAMTDYSNKLHKIWDENYSDMMGAKLKDIGYEDTAAGREIVAELLKNDGWVRDTNIFK